MDNGTDRGTERDTPPSRGAGTGAATEPAAAGRIPLAVVVVDREGLVSHWSRGAGRLFGVPKDDAIGRAAVDLLLQDRPDPSQDEGKPNVTQVIPTLVVGESTAPPPSLQ